MASNTKKTRTVRKRKQTKKAKVRKRGERAKGTTPKFAIHV